MRSNDVYRGLPYNLVQFTTLHEIIAGWLEIELGEYHHVSDSLHAYDETAADIRLSTPGPVSRNEDILSLRKADSDLAFGKLNGLLDLCSQPRLNQSELMQAQDELRVPVAYKNMACVISAETARRWRWRQLAENIMEQCTNPAYTQLYQAWLHRMDVATVNV
jgi:thymidylate synthase